MGMAFVGLTCEELCDLMCGAPEPDYEEKEEKNGKKFIEKRLQIDKFNEADAATRGAVSGRLEAID